MCMFMNCDDEAIQWDVDPAADCGVVSIIISLFAQPPDACKAFSAQLCGHPFLLSVCMLRKCISLSVCLYVSCVCCGPCCLILNKMMMMMYIW